jgi:hypothetical protein
VPVFPGVSFGSGHFRGVDDAENPNALWLAADQLHLAAALLRVVAPANLQIGGVRSLGTFEGIIKSL